MTLKERAGNGVESVSPPKLAPPASVARLQVAIGPDGGRYLVGHFDADVEDGSALVIAGDKATGRYRMHVLSPDEMGDLESLASFLPPEDVDEAERDWLLRLVVKPPKRRRRKKS